MKRNKRTEKVAHESLTRLTEHILDQMGPEGTAIRQRLRRFYRERAVSKTAPCEPEPGTPG